MFRFVYNGLKHAGDDRRKIAPSSDLEVEAHLQREAAHMLDSAKDDFRRIQVTGATRATLSAEFLELLESDEGYA